MRGKGMKDEGPGASGGVSTGGRGSLQWRFQCARLKCSPAFECRVIRKSSATGERLGSGAVRMRLRMRMRMGMRNANATATATATAAGTAFENKAHLVLPPCHLK
jgi:hypothetical protein